MTCDLKLYEAAIVADSVAEHTGHRLTTGASDLIRRTLSFMESCEAELAPEGI